MLKIATIGYERSDIDTFCEALLAAGIQQVIDVRELPLSRKRGFSKKIFAASLLNVGIAYVHLRSLGDPKPGREAARSGRYTEFHKIFSRHMQTKDAQFGLKTAAALAKCKRSALLCFERQHTICHRAIVADALRLDYGFTIEHLTIAETAGESGGVTRRGNNCSCKSGASSRSATR